jgi:exodeoxyribonuclease VII large subunit
MLKPYFETTTQASFGPGIRIMVKVTVEFHELYGFSLNITDIEPSFTLGELALKKQQIIDRLVSEGVFEMNRKQSFPDVPKRIAVISSKTAAGYGDFVDQLEHNPFGYRFHIRLFQTVMQGDEAEHSIAQTFEDIFGQLSSFDAVVMIRGGGSQAELNCFNSYWIASHICQFPLPVLTGIGHERDETIADMVAHTRLKTPTAVAEFLVSKFRMADEQINELTDRLSDRLALILEKEGQRMDRIAFRLRPVVSGQVVMHAQRLSELRLQVTDASRQLITRHSLITGRHISRLQASLHGLFLGLMHRQSLLRNSLRNAGTTFLDGQKHRINLYEKKNHYLDPFRILERGYSVTYHKGKVVRDSREVSSGEPLETRLHEGSLKSRTIE